MNPLGNLWNALRTASSPAKVVAGVVALLFVAIVGLSTYFAQQRHFEVLAGDLDATEMARVTRALAEAAVPFEHSQPPGPFTIYVEEGSRHEAFAAIANAGALNRAPKGIPGVAEGASSVFMSADERSQMVRKREWEDTEGMLETLDFIKQATVRTSGESRSPFGGPAATRASVALVLESGATLDKQQARSVGQLVQFGLDIAPDHLIVTDQSGQIVFDGSDGREEGLDSGAFMAHRTRFENELEERVNGFLTENFGPDRARVKISSEWDFDQSVTRSEVNSPSKAILSESKRTSKTPAGEALNGGAAGSESNLSDPVFGVDATGVAGRDGSSSAVQMAETEDSRKAYAPAKVLTETVRTVPLLQHLSISLIFDEALADRQDELEQAVQAAAGFRQDRGDTFSSMATQFYKPEEVAEGEGTPEGEAESAPSEPNPMLQMLLERGVEIVSAMAFIFLLLKSLKGKKQSAEEIVPAASEDEEPAIDPEALARAQLEELLANEPERVGQILSEWVREENETMARSA